jgi:hypothetical protein
MTDEELIARLRKADEYEPLGHDGWDAADRIKALTEQLTAARDDAKEAEAYAEEVEREQKGWQEAAVKLMHKLTASEAKLAKAVEALREIADPISLAQGNVNAEIAIATLEKLKG